MTNSFVHDCSLQAQSFYKNVKTLYHLSTDGGDLNFSINSLTAALVI